MYSVKMRSLRHWHSLVVLATLLFAFCCPVFGADIKGGNFGATGQNQPEQKRGKRTRYPFSGELESHDGKSVTLKGKQKSRILLLTPATRIYRNGAKCSLSEA